MSDGPTALPPATSDHPVWRALTFHLIGDAGFLPKLQREHGWSTGHAAAVIEEYRRFCFLAATGDRPVTPSDAVDQVWHLHLTYTRDYWERFCPDVIGRAFHHEPAGAGPTERHRHYDQYADTLARYEVEFGAAPPAAIWPSAARLLHGPAMRRVNLAERLVLPRRATLAVLFLLMATVTGVLLWR